MQDQTGKSVLYTNLQHIPGASTQLVQRLTDAVQAYGGSTAASTPPAFVAYFTDSDHPERAIRAALAMRDELAALNEEGHTDTHSTLRVAVNTITGREADYAPHTPLDDDRVLARVPPNSVVVSHATYRHVRGVFDVDPVNEIDPEGDLRDTHYIIISSRPRQFRLRTRAVAGRETVTVGRGAERAQLINALHDMLNTEHLRVVSLVGPPGIGKSRLVYELRNYLELFDRTVWLLEATGRADTRHLPYGVLRDLFTFRFEIFSSDTAATARRALERGVQRFMPGKHGQAAAHFIGQLIGLEFMYSEHLRVLNERGQPVRERAIEAVASFFAALAANDPAVIILSGLHHADDASLDALRYIFQSCRGSRLLFVTTSSDSILQRQPNWADTPHHDLLYVEPLTDTQTLALSEQILRRTSADADTVRRAIATHSAGNPLVLEEAALYSLGHVGTEREPTAPDLPPLEEMVRRRIADLSADERTVLAHAACVGMYFWVDALRAVLPDLPPLRLAEVLMHLEAQDFIHGRALSSFSMTAEYAFRHEQLFDIVRTHLPTSPDAHARFAVWRTSHSAQRVNEYAGLLAQRYQAAQRPDQAAEYYIRAAKHARTVGALSEAVLFLRRALQLLDDSAVSKRASLQSMLGWVEWQLGELEAAAKSLPLALTLTERVGDMLLKAQVLTTMGAVAHADGHYADARVHFEAALQFSREVGDRRAISDNLMRLGELALDSDDLDRAQECFNESLSIYQTMRHEHRIATIFLSMSRLSLRKSSRDEAETLAVTALRIAHRHNSVQLLLRTMLHIASIRQPTELALAQDIVTHVNNHPFATPLLRAEVKHLSITPARRSIDTQEFQAIVARFL
jgi:tetratricopeptide (TPR) repeat protein